MKLIIVSGTRHATTAEHRPEVEARLAQCHSGGEVTLVHGDASGVDRLAAFIANGWAWNVVAVPAQWQTCAAYIPRELGGCPAGPHLRSKGGRTWCPYAGHRRNQQMLNDYPEADFVLAFPAIGSAGKSGTWDLVHRAADAGLTPQIFPLAVQRPQTLPLILPDNSKETHHA
jgi:hypothetical protein